MDANHEIIIPNKGLPFKMFIFEGKNGNYVRNKHWHTSIEIFAVFKGSVRFFLNDEEYYLKEGEFVIVNSNEVHSIFCTRFKFDISYSNSTCCFLKSIILRKISLHFHMIPIIVIKI